MDRPKRRAFLQTVGWGAAAAAAGGPATVAAGPRLANEGAAGAGAPAWDDLVSRATAEGTLALVTWGSTWGGSGYPTVIERFQQAFPGIVVTPWLAESSASVWLGKVRQGQRNGGASFDLALVQPDAALREGRPAGMWAPIKPLLMRPDVLDDGVWHKGLSTRFLDAGGDLCFAWEHYVLHAYAVDTEIVPVGEIKTVKDLLHPRWSGKIISSDPRIGLGLNIAAGVANSWGIDVVKRLLVDQRPTFSGAGSDLAAALVRRRYPIALGLRPKALQPFLDQGLADRIAFLDLPDADVAATTSLLSFDRAPHPAAARLFANWILTNEGQTVLASSLPTNSARTDVEPFAPDGIGTAGTSYFEPDREANYQRIAETRQFIAGLRVRTP